MTTKDLKREEQEFAYYELPPFVKIVTGIDKDGTAWVGRAVNLQKLIDKATLQAYKQALEAAAEHMHKLKYKEFAKEIKALPIPGAKRN